MYNGYKVGVVIFAGRAKFMKITMSYLQNNNIIDTIYICNNVRSNDDLNYVKELHKYFNKIKYINLPSNFNDIKMKYPNLHCFNWYCFYSQTVNNDEIYIKIDDDIVYLSQNCIEKIVEARLKYKECGLVYATIVNNPFSNLLFDNVDLTKPVNEIMYKKFEDSDYAVKMHKAFLEDQTSFKLQTDIFFDDSFCLRDNNHSYFIRPSINTICYFGYDMLRWVTLKNNVAFMYDDEQFMTKNLFEVYNFKHVMIKDAIVSHYSFCGQKLLQDYESEFLPQYAKLMCVDGYVYEG